MNEHVIDDGRARRFLLGQMPPEEQGRIEELAFADPDVFAFLQAAENDLMDAFLYGELSSEEEKGFEKHFLTKPGRCRDLRIARALKQHLDPENQTVPVEPNKDPVRNISFWQRLGLSNVTGPLAATAVVVVAIAVIWLVIRSIRRDETPPLQAQHQQATPIPTPSSLATETPSVTTPTPVQKETPPPRNSPSPRQPGAPVYSVILTPGGPLRSENEGEALALPSRSVEFELPLVRETTYRSYQAFLQKDEQTIRSWNNLRLKRRKSGQAIIVTVPQGVLEKSQRYRIVLNGVSSGGKSQQVHTYHFRMSETEVR